LVAGRAKEAKEYECRLKAMQEQLRHQSDRHHAEIEETRRRNDENLTLMRDEVKDEIRRVEGDKVAQLDSELKVQKRSYEQMKADYTARVREHQQKAREVAADFQQKNEEKQNELERVSTRFVELDRSVTQKDNEIVHLKKCLAAAKEKLDDDIRKLEAQANTEIHKSKQILDQERKSFASTESSLQADIAALEGEKAAIERKSREQAEDLSQRINIMQRQVAEMQSVVKKTRNTSFGFKNSKTPCRQLKMIYSQNAVATRRLRATFAWNLRN
jgi:chromosome segregation ATPase